MNLIGNCNENVNKAKAISAELLELKGLATLKARVKLTKMLDSRHLMLIPDFQNFYHMISCRQAQFEDTLIHDCLLISLLH